MRSCANILLEKRIVCCALSHSWRAFAAAAFASASALALRNASVGLGSAMHSRSSKSASILGGVTGK